MTKIIWKHLDGRQVIELVNQSGEITYDANFNLDQAMYDWGREDNWDHDTFADPDDCKDNGYMMIQEWLEDEQFEEA